MANVQLSLIIEWLSSARKNINGSSYQFETERILFQDNFNFPTKIS